MSRSALFRLAATCASSLFSFDWSCGARRSMRFHMGIAATGGAGAAACASLACRCSSASLTSSERCSSRAACCSCKANAARHLMTCGSNCWCCPTRLLYLARKPFVMTSSIACRSSADPTLCRTASMMSSSVAPSSSAALRSEFRSFALLCSSSGSSPVVSTVPSIASMACRALSLSDFSPSVSSRILLSSKRTESSSSVSRPALHM
mmetsp:Transcript_58306/g.165807  ORF Transcript_58306/g.165807 Transcript_58306/m.165807 type:complete len:207 (-) Transcript_58306:532-1152(-)